MDLQSVVDLLYGGPVETFIKVRDEQAAAAKTSGDSELAAEIRALRRPSAGAWLMNLLVRHHTGEVDALLAMGETLRQAAGLDGDELRTTLTQRREREAALLDLASELAAEHGVTATHTVLAEVRACLAAGLADQEAAELIRSGRLVKPLGYGGFADATATAPAAASKKPAAERTEPKSTKVTSTPRPVAPAKLRGARERLAKAERQAATAREKAETADQRRQDARAVADETRDDVADLQRFLTNRLADLKMAERNADAAERAHVEALRKAEQAEGAIAAAQQAIADLT